MRHIGRLYTLRSEMCLESMRWLFFFFLCWLMVNGLIKLLDRPHISTPPVGVGRWYHMCMSSMSRVAGEPYAPPPPAASCPLSHTPNQRTQDIFPFTGYLCVVGDIRREQVSNMRSTVKHDWITKACSMRGPRVKITILAWGHIFWMLKEVL